MSDYFDDVKKLIDEKKECDNFLKAQGHCIVCGHEDPLDLEYHHLAGKANSSLVISLCRNCHGRISRRQRVWPQGWSKNNSTTKRLAILLRGISDILRVMSDYLWRIED